MCLQVSSYKVVDQNTQNICQRKENKCFYERLEADSRLCTAQISAMKTVCRAAYDKRQVVTVT